MSISFSCSLAAVSGSVGGSADRPVSIAEQIVGIPVPRGRVQGFRPVQSSTASPSSLERISEQVVEQIVDISPGGGLGQGSSSSAGPADEDFTGGFRTFPQI